MTFSFTLAAQCDPPPPQRVVAPPTTHTPNAQPAPPSNKASTPSTPSPASPSAPAPDAPEAGGPPAARSPAPALTTGPRTGGMPLVLTRGDTSKNRLKLEWLHPVPPQRTGSHTVAAGPLPLEEALAVLWEGDDQRPLLVLRECQRCKDGDQALLTRSAANDRTVLLSKWFRTVRLPAHVVEPGHAFYNVFAGHGFDADDLPHFFLLAQRGAKPVAFTGVQTQTQLWKGMQDVLSQRYAKDPAKAVKEWLQVLDAFDTVDARRRQLEDQLAEARANEGPDSAKAKKFSDALARTEQERTELLAQEAKVRDLGLVPLPPALGAAAK